MLLVTGIVYHRNFYGYITYRIMAIAINYGGKQGLAAAIFIDQLNKFNDTAFAVKSFCISISFFIFFTQVIKYNADFFIQKRQFP